MPPSVRRAPCDSTRHGSSPSTWPARAPPGQPEVPSLLLALGFDERVIDGKYLGFYHSESDTLFAFRMYRPQGLVNRVDLRDVRKELDLRGLLGEAAFDAALRKASASRADRLPSGSPRRRRALARNG
jgi:hypothetical protein